ncbi:MAG: hypothetical protein ACKOHM_12305, partial [Spartobacteria bacterium]
KIQAQRAVKTEPTFKIHHPKSPIPSTLFFSRPSPLYHAGVAKREGGLSSAANPKSNIQNPSSGDSSPRSSFCFHTSPFSSSARTFVLGATRARQLLAVLQ